LSAKKRGNTAKTAREAVSSALEILRRMISERVRPMLGNPFSPAYYMSLGYIFMIAVGLHIFVTLKFGAEAAIALYRLTGAGSPGIFVALLEGLALALAAYSFYTGFKLFDDQRLAFTYGLYNVASTLPYLNLMFIALSSITVGPTGIEVRGGRLVVAALYVLGSLLLIGIASGAPFAIVQLYRAKRTGEFTLIDAPPGATVRYDEGDTFRLIYTGRKDKGAPMILFIKSGSWDIKTRYEGARLEALFRPLAPVEDTLTLSLRGKPIYRINLRPARVITVGNPDTEIHIELIMAGEGGKTIRKIIIQRPGGVPLSKVLQEVIPEGHHIQRILRIEKGRYVPVKDPEKETIKPRTLNRVVVETIPAAKPAKMKAKPASPGITASAPQAVQEPGPEEPAPRIGTVQPVGSELVDRVKRLIEEYTELREDLW